MRKALHLSLSLVTLLALLAPVHASAAGLSFARPGSQVSLNPQPIPPKESFQHGGRGGQVQLNPQPIPPGDFVKLNPQPIPPKEAFRFK